MNGLKPAGLGTFKSLNVTVQLESKGEWLKRGLVTFSPSRPQDAGQWLDALTGRAYSSSLLDYVKANGQTIGAATAQKPVQILAEPYAIGLYAQKNTWVMDVALAEVSSKNFLSTKNAVGDPKAPIVIRVFSDFECPYCQKLESEFLIGYKKKLPKDVRLEFHHMPLSEIHLKAIPAAEASECAGAQGHFWDYHDQLFRDRSWIRAEDTQAVFLDLAADLKLNLGDFKRCLEAHTYKNKVSSERSEGVKLGVQGTPTVFVNQFRIENPYEISNYERLYRLLR
ncbi:MAG: thioredoxin domain-containing protein [Deinococcaceae bacterium]